MQDQKIDRRTRKTKSILLKTLTELMTKKKINEITVKELTDLADVNRSTFYLYYKDIFDMLEQVENEMLADFSENFGYYIKNTNDQDTTIEFFTHIFEHVQIYSDICKILLGPEGDYCFIEKFKKVIIQTKPPFDESIPEITIHFLRPYIISGCVGIVQQWIFDGLKISPKDMANLMTEFIQSTTRDYKV